MNKFLNILLVCIIFMVDTSSSILFSQVLWDKRDVSLASTSQYEIIKGTIIDKETGLGIPFASIAIYEGRRQVLGQVSDSLGMFVVKLNPELLSDSIFDIKFTSVGYTAYTIKKINLKQNLSKQYYTVELLKQQIYNGGMPDYVVSPIHMTGDTLK